MGDPIMGGGGYIDARGYMDALNANSALDAIEHARPFERMLALRWITFDMGDSFAEPSLLARLCVNLDEVQIQRVVPLVLAKYPELQVSNEVVEALHPHLVSIMRDDLYGGGEWDRVLHAFDANGLAFIAPRLLPHLPSMSMGVQNVALAMFVDTLPPEQIAAHSASYIEEILQRPPPPINEALELDDGIDRSMVDETAMFQLMGLQSTALRALKPGWPELRVVTLLQAQLQKGNAILQIVALETLAKHPIPLTLSSKALERAAFTLSELKNPLNTATDPPALGIQTRVRAVRTFLMGSHHRVGADSVVRLLPPAVLYLIAEMM